MLTDQLDITGVQIASPISVSAQCLSHFRLARFLKSSNFFKNPDFLEQSRDLLWLWETTANHGLEWILSYNFAVELHFLLEFKSLSYF